MQRLIVFILLLGYAGKGSIQAQDISFSQPNAMPLYMNPGFAGSKGGVRLIAGGHLQWMNQMGGYSASYFSYDQYLRCLRGGLGLEAYSVVESGGAMGSDFIRMSYSPTISVGKRKDDSTRQVVIKPGVYVGIGNHYNRWDKFSWGDMIAPAYGFIYSTNEVENKNNVQFPDFGTGILVYGKQFYGGVSLAHITEPEMGFLFTGTPLPIRTIVQGGYCLQGQEWLGKFTLSPSIIYENQSGWNMLNVTITGTRGMFIGGISGRSVGAVCLMGGVQYKFLKAGYSWAMLTSKDGSSFGSTHELTLGFNFANRKDKKKIRTLDFPAL